VSILNHEKISVLAGGPSCEREVSLVSGRAVYEALSSQGLSVNLIDPSGDFVTQLKKEKTTLCFIALHGTFGEDGTVQRMLDEADLLYTGSGPLASERAFHKSKAQNLFQKAQIPVPDFFVLRPNEASLKLPPSSAYPVVVKPSAAGSSVGVHLVTNEQEFISACQEAFRYSDEILVERYIHGRELTVGILEDKSLPVVEVILKRVFYDYEAKYGDSGTQYECPARLSPQIESFLRETALKAHQTLGCEVMSRADFILSKGEGAYLLEVNTIPGLTGKSLLPKAAKAAGIDFPALCVKILEHSLKKRFVSR
jgi:D-alanine-D-alanine ligase